jgi:hypothetical protein
VSGTFGDRLAPHLSALRAGDDPNGDLTVPVIEQCRAVIEGQRAFSDLPAPCARLLADRREAVHGALAATHAAEAGLPEGLRILSDPGHELQKDGGQRFLRAANAAALEVREALAAGQGGQALETCTDGLALGRDAAWGAGIRGDMIGSKVVDTLFRPCSAAIDAAPASAKRTAMRALTTLRKGWPPLSGILREEAVSFEVTAFGGLLDDARARQLPREAALMSSAGFTKLGAGLLGPWLLRDLWRLNVEQWDARVAAADQEPAQRDRVLEAVGEHASHSANPLAAVAGPDFRRFAQRDDHARLQLDMLLRAAAASLQREEEGRWPAGVEGLCADAPKPLAPITIEVLSKDGSARLTSHDHDGEMVISLHATSAPAAP